MPVRRQQRGEERRRETMEAALRVIGREGIRATTHRAVAQEASASLSATTYYFASIDDLIAQAFAHYVDERLAVLQQVMTEVAAAGSLGVDQAKRLFAEYISEELSRGRLRLAAEHELAVEGIRNPAVAEQYDRLGRSLETYLAGLMGLAGSRQPVVDARVLLAFSRGLELDEITRRTPTPDAEIRALCHRAIDAILTG